MGEVEDIHLYFSLEMFPPDSAFSTFSVLIIQLFPVSIVREREPGTGFLEGNKIPSPPPSVAPKCLCHSSLPILVGGFNPSEKYDRQIGSFPQIGMKIKNI